MLPEQSVEARFLLEWSQFRLALAAQLTFPAVAAFEGGSPSAADVILALQAALEAAGVVFIDQNGGGAGVRLRIPDTAHCEKCRELLYWPVEAGREVAIICRNCGNNCGTYGTFLDRAAQ